MRAALGITLALASAALPMRAQTTTETKSTTDTKPAPAKPASEKFPRIPYQMATVENTRTFYLKSVSQVQDGNELLTAMRNMLEPSVKMYLVPSRNAIIITSTPEELALAEKIIHDLDRPTPIYHLTYTVTESDAGKRIGVQHFSELVASGGRTTTKQGSKIPVITGSYSTANSAAQQQFTYLDVGMNIDASVDELPGGVRLKSKIEASSVADAQAIGDVREPIIRQTVIEGTSVLTVGKPQVLGSVDVAGSTRHLDVEVVLEPVK